MITAVCSNLVLADDTIASSVQYSKWFGLQLCKGKKAAGGVGGWGWGGGGFNNINVMKVIVFNTSKSVIILKKKIFFNTASTVWKEYS